MTEQSSSSIAMEAQSQSSKFVPVTFSNFTTIRLDNNNFLCWRKQVFTAIRGYKLHDFVLGTKAPPKKFLQQIDEENGVLNPEFTDWEQQDQLLVSWLLSTMTEGILSRMINCETSSQVWNTLEQFFASQTRAKVSQYQTQLKNFKKNSLTMNEYMLKIREIVNLLAMAGEKITAKEHIAALFSGLNEDYENFITSFDLRNQINSVEEVESLLLSQEARIDQKNKAQEHSTSQFMANFAGLSVQDKKRFSNSQNVSPSAKGNNTGQNQGGPRGGFSSNRGRGRSQGRGHWSANKPQCQLCGKFGHVVLQCYHRFDQAFQGPNQSPHSQNFQGSYHAGRGSGRGFTGQQMSALLAAPSQNVGAIDTNWYPDSGATNHVSADQSNLMTKTEFFGPDQVYIGDGSNLQNCGFRGEAP